MTNMTYYQLQSEDLRLILKPAISNQDAIAKFDLRVSIIGLIGAALFMASIQVPALITYNNTPKLQPKTYQFKANAYELKQTDTKQDDNSKTDNAVSTVKDIDFYYTDLGIFSPVTWEIEYDNTQIQRHLQNGLVHIKDTAKPGQRGTIILTGHSSNFAWAKGDYKTIFAPLLKAQLNQTITIEFEDTKYEYIVDQIYEVTPNQVDLINNSNESDLRLITCTPLGSTKKRLIIDAKQVSPDRSSNSEFNSNSIDTQSILEVR